MYNCGKSLTFAPIDIENQHSMARIKNPFVVTGKIEKEYFCDRALESKKIVKSIENGNNLVLISPRRMGKTGLVRYCNDFVLEKDEYYTFFVDILHTTSLKEFTYLLGRKIYETVLPRSRKMMTFFIQTLKSISGQFGFDPVSNTPTFDLTLGDIVRPELTLEEIFYYLEHADRPCIVTIDEFQQIAKYQEGSVEALLRTHIQSLSNCQFIFAGSEYHIMQEMFVSSAHPFYNSADIMELKAIPPGVYSDFVRGWMGKYAKELDAALVEWVHRLFRGNTYGMQRTFNEVFAITDAGETCTKDTVLQAIYNIIESKEPLFQELLSTVPEKQKPLLYAIAAEGEVDKITSAAFIKKYRLASASANQYAARQLVSSGIVTKLYGKYSINEQFFDIWINHMYGSGISFVKLYSE